MIPLSFAQQRLWFLNRFEGPGSTYNIPVVARLHGALDVPALEAALKDVVTRHELLRTAFGEVGGEAYQEVLDDGPALSAAGFHEHALRAAVDHAFDLSAEPAVRAHLFKVAPDEHVLALVMHHIVSDGWSLGPLLRDLSTAYTARLDAREPDWKPLPVQYADYALWQRELFADEAVTAGELSFWRDALAGIPEELTLPVDRARPAVVSHRGEQVRLELPAATHAGLRDVARETRASLFMVLQAGVATLLSRLGAGTDIPLGTAVAGRTDEALDDLVGFFVNPLVLRTDVSGRPTFRELVRRVCDANRAAYAHQELPFERLVEELNPVRSPGRHPLFQVMVVLQNNLEPRLELPGLRAELEVNGTGVAKNDLTVAMAERFGADGAPDGLTVTLEYATDLFDRPTVEVLGRRLERLMAAVTANRDVPVDQIELLSDGERDELLHRLAGTVHPHPLDIGVHEAFEQQARRTPGSTALVFGAETVTYAELNAWANRFARYLVARGIGRGDVVGLYIERGIEMVGCLLGVLKAGAAYTMLDVDHPVERVNTLVSAVGASLVVTGDRWRDRLAHGTVALGDIELADQKADDLGVTVHPEATACVMFTSGSTGVPKGVVSAHRALLGTVSGQDFAEFDARQAWLQCAPVSWDAFNTELFYPLLAGAVCVLQPGQKPDPGVVAELVMRHGVTVLECSATLFDHLVDEYPEAIARLHRGMPGGEPASPTHCGTALRDFPGIRLTNGYGPVESMGFTTAHEITTRDTEGASIPIGVPLAGKYAYVLDARLQPVPRGVPGELYLAGVGLAHGYARQPALTAERFVACPFGGRGTRMYRTGDLARWNADGVLEFLGRADDQVKLRGFRVELGDVGSVLARRSDVDSVAILLREDQPGDKRLVAYVVPGADFATEKVRAEVAAVLPDYMVPSAFVVLDALPLTPNGKLDRHALPAPDYGVLSSGRRPRSPREEILCGLFAETLGLASVTIDDDFFALGGHSLLAMRLAGRIRDALGVEVGLPQLFDSPTVALLAMHLEPDATQLARPSARERPAEIPASFAQQRLWFLNRLEGPSPTYNAPVVLRLRGDLHVPALEAALRDVVMRHEVLRTMFREADDQIYQVVLDSGPTLAVADHSAESLRSALDHAFDLSAEPAVRAHLFKVAPDEHVLALVMHHIVSDGWSLGPLLRDLSTAYTARLDAREPDWKPLPVQYADYALWQRELLTGDSPVLRRQLDFWRDALARLPEQLDLPTDQVRPAVPSYRGERVSFALPPELRAGLVEVARRTRSTLFMVLQAGVAALLSRVGAGTDIPLGTAIAGRTDSALDDLVGFFVNTLVLRADVSGQPTFAELVRRVRDTDLAAYAHQDLPFERLVEELNPTRSLSRHPLFQVMVELHNTEPVRPELAGLDVTSQPVDMGVAKFDLSWDFVERAGDDRIECELGYTADLFDRQTAERLAAWLVRLLEAAVADPSSPVGQLSLVDTDERTALLHGDYRPPHDDLDRGVVQRIRAHAATRPDAIAVVDERGSTSYASLVHRASRVARRLAAAGAGLGTVVPVLARRGAAVIEGIVGILNAGSVYLPLDPKAPPARNAGLIEDVRAVHLVADAEHADLAHRLAAEAEREVQVLVLDRAADDDLASLVGGPDDLAYVIFTSGSTGRPKGAMVHRGGMLNNLLCEADALGVTGPDLIASTAPLTFDISVWQMFVPLIFGGTVRAVDDETVRDPCALFRLAADERVTVLQVVPSLLRAALEEWDAVGGLPHDLALRHLAVTGEALPAAVCLSWSARFPGIPLVNCYGPTECSDDVTHAVISADALPANSRTPIGRPVRGSRLYVLDEHLEPTPPGIPGELYIGGAVVGRGYLADPARTATTFVADPFTPEPGARMYRTGDMVRYRADGLLEFLGRRDHQVKIRGQRIELGEIEHALRTLDGVRDAVVTAQPGPGGHLVLVGYYTGGGNPRAVRGGLAALLAEAMVPGVLLPVDGFPLTPNGKLDRAALPAPDLDALTGGRAAATPTQRALCGIFADVLGVPRVAADGNFFELGGHSLLAVRLVRRICEVLGVDLPLGAVFEHRTVAELDALIGSAGGTAAEEVDLAAEAVLAPEVTIEGSEPADPARIEHVLLTGCTGFLGAFLLERVLRVTGATVHCLVRATSPAQARARIEQNMRRHRVELTDELWRRVAPVRGDLAKPLLGMDSARFDELAGLIDAIYHNGATVNLMEPYHRLKAANVGGTHEIFRLAARKRVTPVHYVSTISTLVPGPGAPEALPEKYVTDQAALGPSGYVRTKWVAERMAEEALRRGIPVAVYRPGRIAGHSQTGSIGGDDAFWHYLRACVELKAMPDADWHGLAEDLVPVDHVAAAFVHIATTREPDGAAYALPGSPTTLRSVLTHARSAGYELAEVPYATWSAMLADAAMSEPPREDSSVHAVALLDSGMREARETPPRRYGTRNTDRALAGSGISCPPVDGALLDAYFRFFTDSGFLPPATGS